MEFDFNDLTIGKKLFPQNCPYCGAEIRFQSFEETFGYYKENGGNLYVCSNYPDCCSYTFAHKASLGGAIENMPQGLIADPTLRSTHDYLRRIFNPMWQEKTISRIYNKFVLSFEVDGETRYGTVESLDRDNKLYVLKTETGEEFSIPIDETHKIDTRSRAHYWLASMLNIPFSECKIPCLDFDKTCDAINIVEESLKVLSEHK